MKIANWKQSVQMRPKRGHSAVSVNKPRTPLVLMKVPCERNCDQFPNYATKLSTSDRNECHLGSPFPWAIPNDALRKWRSQMANPSKPGPQLETGKEDQASGALVGGSSGFATCPGLVDVAGCESTRPEKQDRVELKSRHGLRPTLTL